MNLILQFLTIAAMLGITYVIFMAFGPQRSRIGFTAEEKSEWDQLISQKIGSWFAITNIVGTLSSLATVYIFFIGSSKLFGAWVFLCSLTIIAGSAVTNLFTRRVIANPSVKHLLASSDQTGGVIARLFWSSKTEHSIAVAAIVKWISLFNIASVIWLEFALFADISGLLIGDATLPTRTVLLAICCFAVVFFTLRYGLRGFVFADFFQSPLLALASLFLVIGIVILIVKSNGAFNPSYVFTPLVSTVDCVLFAIQVFSLNLFLVLVTEPHWLRVWIFQQKEINLQLKSVSLTGILWAILALAGLLAFTVTGEIGERGVYAVLAKLSDISPLFLVAFWIGGIAALFSTADSQIYSILLVHSFNSKSGNIDDSRFLGMKPLVISIVSTLVFCGIYVFVRRFDVPFDKMIFVVLPFCLNILPCFFLLVNNRPQHPGYVIASMILYSSCSAYGFIQDTNDFAFTLLAPFCPILVSSYIVLQSSLKLGRSEQ